MFVVKDKRKVGEILADPSDDRHMLALGRRAPEFTAGTEPLLRASNANALGNVSFLSLANDGLSALSGLSTLANAGAPLETLVLSSNALSTLPASIARFASTLKVRDFCVGRVGGSPCAQ